MSKRILSTALVLLMCLCTLSFPAFAAGTPTASASYSDGAVSVSGTGYAAGTDYIVRVVDTTNSSLTAMTQTAADGDGNISVSVTTGALVTLSDYTAYVNQLDGGNVATASITERAVTTYTATVVAGTGGSIAAGTNGQYAAGAVISLKATANSNYTFSKWTSSNGGTFANANSAATTFTMPAANVTITANFTRTGGGGNGGGGNGGGGGGGSGSGTTVTPTPTPSGDTFASDTTADLSVNGAYQFKITSTNGAVPNFVVGTSGVFNTQLVSVSGNVYYIKLTAVGKPGDKAGVYVNGVRLLVATVGTTTSLVKSDTTAPFGIRAGKSYLIRLTADSKPTLVVGNSSVFRVDFVKSSGKDYFFRITAVGRSGQAAGFYINSEKTPVTVATIA